MFAEAPSTVPGLAALWVRTVEEDGSARILPDACWDLVWRDGTVELVGPDTRAWDSPLRRGETILGARFATGSGTALGFPLAEIRDARVPYAELDDPRRELPALAARLLRERPPDPAVTEAARRLADPRRRVAGVADELGLSERQLRRRCLAAAGYGPKMLQRVLRFRRFLALPAGDLAERALAAGYADQAHLTNECSELAGMPPSALLAAR